MSRKGVLLGTVAAVCLGAAAEALPFWGDGSPVTGRVAAVQKVLFVDGPFESRTVDAVSLSLDRFTSRAPGLHIHFR